MRKLSVALAVVLLSAGCGDGDDYLSQSVVTALPTGTAEGSDVSGEYDLEIYTTSCSGACELEFGEWALSLCEVGNIDEDTVTVTQTDGHLQVDSEGGLLWISRMTGGIWEDGTFDVGGYATEGNQAHITSRTEGVINDSGQLTGLSRAHGWGTYEGQSFNCTATYDVTGQRIGM